MIIPYGRQSLDEDDIAAVASVLRSDWLTTGPAGRQFEEDLCTYTGARFAVAYSSGTAALHGACWAAGLGPGDLVATSALTFSASANCARYVGADVSLVDIDPGSWNASTEGVDPESAAFIAVHYAGLPPDLRGLPTRPRVIIEDAAHSMGALTPDGTVGNCADSDMCCFSFHPVKSITTGEGGAVTTNDESLAERLRIFRHHGIVPTPQGGAWCYDIPELGYNYRLSDIGAALGSSQLRKIERFVLRRNELAARYRELLAGFPVTLPPEAGKGFRHGYHLFPILVADRRRVFDELRARGIGVQVHYVPIYRLTAYSTLGFEPASFPVTERVYAGLLSLPLYPDLRDEDQDFVVDALEAVL